MLQMSDKSGVDALVAALMLSVLCSSTRTWHTCWVARMALSTAQTFSACWPQPLQPCPRCAYTSTSCCSCGTLTATSSSSLMQGLPSTAGFVTGLSMGLHWKV